MQWQQFQAMVQDQPVFETAQLITGETTRRQAQQQVSDWHKLERIVQLRRGIYTLPDRNPHPFVIANHLVNGSYVSLQMALGYYHLIPEHVAVVTSVTTQRPARYENKLGYYTYRHIHRTMFYGIEYRLLVDDEYAFIATPEKALLDLIYLRPQGDSVDYIESLRLQNLEILDIECLYSLAERSDKPKLQRAAEVIDKIAQREAEEYELL